MMMLSLGGDNKAATPMPAGGAGMRDVAGDGAEANAAIACGGTTSYWRNMHLAPMLLMKS